MSVYLISIIKVRLLCVQFTILKEVDPESQVTQRVTNLMTRFYVCNPQI